LTDDKGKTLNSSQIKQQHRKKLSVDNTFEKKIADPDAK
jgi:hypothetical protein